MQTSHTAAVELYWIPLGAGGHSVRLNGRVFEAIAAAASIGDAATSITPRSSSSSTAIATRSSSRRRRTLTRRAAAWSPPAPSAAATPAGCACFATRSAAGAAGRFRISTRRSAGPRRLSSDPRDARRLLDLVRTVPTPVWGRDELKTGEMWNSNSMTAWLIAATGLSTDLLRPPPRGRAPGWDAGIEVARRRPARERDTATLRRSR